MNCVLENNSFEQMKYGLFGLVESNTLLSIHGFLGDEKEVCICFLCNNRNSEIGL